MSRAASVVPTRRHQAPSVWVMTTISGSHRPAGAKGEAQRAAQRRPRVEAAADRPGPKSRGKGALRQSRICDLLAVEGWTGGGAGESGPALALRRRPGSGRCCVASRAADRPSASCRHLSGRSRQARLATHDSSDDPARSARASARGASGARAAASNHWRLQLQQRAAARSIDLMGAAKNQKEAGG